MLMTNVANVNVPGYKRQDLDFNILLDEAQQETRDRMADRRATRSSLRNDGNNVDMEREVFSIAETDLRYQALTDMTTRFFSGLRNVIREGR
jgi:flagellar basal-body rod protein FlgB